MRRATAGSMLLRPGAGPSRQRRERGHPENATLGHTLARRRPRAQGRADTSKDTVHHVDPARLATSARPALAIILDVARPRHSHQASTGQGHARSCGASAGRLSRYDG